MHDAGVSGLAQGDAAPLELEPDPELEDEPDDDPEDDPDDDEEAEPEEPDPEDDELEPLPELPPDELLDASCPDPESLLAPPASSRAVLVNGSDAPPQCDERRATIATMPSEGVQNRPVRTVRSSVRYLSPPVDTHVVRAIGPRALAVAAQGDNPYRDRWPTSCLPRNSTHGGPGT